MTRPYTRFSEQAMLSVNTTTRPFGVILDIVSDSEHTATFPHGAGLIMFNTPIEVYWSTISGGVDQADTHPDKIYWSGGWFFMNVMEPVTALYFKPKNSGETGRVHFLIGD